MKHIKWINAYVIAICFLTLGVLGSWRICDWGHTLVEDGDFSSRVFGFIIAIFTPGPFLLAAVCAVGALDYAANSHRYPPP